MRELSEQERRDVALMIERTRSEVRAAEIGCQILCLAVSVAGRAASPDWGSERGEGQTTLKMQAAMDTFKQGFQLLRDLLDGK